MAGVNVLAAWRRDDETEDSWPGSAPTNPGAGHRIPLKSENITKRPAFQDRGALFNQVTEEAPKLSAMVCGGTIECDLRYGDLDRLYAAGMGFENPDTDAAGGSPAQLAAGEFRHVYECHEDLRSKVWNAGDRAVSTGSPGDPGYWTVTDRKQARGGLYIHKPVSDWRLWPAMVNGMEFRVNPRESSVTFDLVGYDLARGGSYGSGSWTSFNSQSYNDDPGVSQVLLHQLNAKWGPANGNVWAQENMGISELSVRLENNLVVDQFDASGGLYILEPWRNGMRKVTGSFLVTRYTNDGFSSYLEGDLAVMFMFEFTGPSLGTNNASLVLGIPAAKLSVVSSTVGGPEVIQQRVEFEAYEPSTLGTVWQGSGKPFEGVTLTQNANGRAGELLLATVNEYDENVFEFV